MPKLLRHIASRFDHQVQVSCAVEIVMHTLVHSGLQFTIRREVDEDVPEHCGIETSSTGRFISERLATTKPHFMVGAQKKTRYSTYVQTLRKESDRTQLNARIGETLRSKCSIRATHQFSNPQDAPIKRASGQQPYPKVCLSGKTGKQWISG